jgi:hypothetical protein
VFFSLCLTCQQGDVEAYLTTTVPPLKHTSTLLDDFQLLENGKCYDFKLEVKV